MKGKFGLAAVVRVLAVTVLLLPPVFPLTAGGSSRSDLEMAIQAASKEISIDTPVILGWEGARPDAGQPFYDLQGNQIAYWFDVVREGEVLGGVVVGSSAYGYTTFEAGARKPTVPTSEQVALALHRDLGLNTIPGELRQPLRLLYLGYDAYYAL